MIVPPIDSATIVIILLSTTCLLFAIYLTLKRPRR